MARPWYAYTPEALSLILDAAEEQSQNPQASLIHQATVLLTDAQIKALPGGVATEGVFEVVAAPGVNKVILPVTTALITSFAAGAYGNVSADGQWAMLVGASLSDYADVSVALRNIGGSAPVTGFLEAWERFLVLPGKLSIRELGTSDTFVADLGVFDLPTVKNQPVLLYVYNAAGDYTGGHASNTLRVSVSYQILNVTTGLFE